MKRFLPSVIGLLSAGLLSASPAYISDVELSGDCDFDDIRVVEENGQYYIAAYFDSIYAHTYENHPFDSKRCTMNYKVKLNPRYALDLFQFSVNGTYELSDHGTARVTVSHRASNGKTVRTTEQFSLRRGSDYFGDFTDHTGDITRWDLSTDHQRCGASIPLTSSVFVHAAQPASDGSGQTVIALDDGVSSHYTKLCKVKFKRC